MGENDMNYTLQFFEYLRLGPAWGMAQGNIKDTPATDDELKIYSSCDEFEDAITFERYPGLCPRAQRPADEVSPAQSPAPSPTPSSQRASVPPPARPHSPHPSASYSSSGSSSSGSARSCSRPRFALRPDPCGAWHSPRRSAPPSKPTASRTSRTPRRSSQRDFLVRSPPLRCLGSPPLAGSPRDGVDGADVTVTTTCSSRAAEDLESFTANPCSSPPPPRPLDVADHDYAMLAVGDVVEVEVEADVSDADLVMTPDSLEGGSTADGVPHGVPIQDVSLLLWMHVRNAAAGSAARECIFISPDPDCAVPPPSPAGAAASAASAVVGTSPLGSQQDAPGDGDATRPPQSGDDVMAREDPPAESSEPAVLDADASGERGRPGSDDAFVQDEERPQKAPGEDHGAVEAGQGQGPDSSHGSLASIDLFDNEEALASLPSSPDPIPASQAAFMAMSRRTSHSDSISSLGDISDLEGVDIDGDTVVESKYGEASPARQSFLNSSFENMKTLASLGDTPESDQETGLLGHTCNTSLDADGETPSKLMGRSWIVDIEAETFQQFPYYNNNSEENPPDILLQDEEKFSHLKENQDSDFENVLVSKEYRNELLEDESQTSFGSSSTSTSPYRDLDALHLTQSAPLKRKASSKILEQQNVKRSRKNWEQWYEQFKTIVITGEQKKIAQGKFLNKADGMDAVQADCDLELLSPELLDYSQYKKNCKESSSPQDKSVPHCSTSSRVTCDQRGNAFNTPSQHPDASTNTDQRVPEESWPLDPKPCHAHPHQKDHESLYRWTKDENAMKPGDEFSETVLYGQEIDLMEEPKEGFKPQRSVLRLGLSKRYRPRPLHPQKPKWWVPKCTVL